MQSSRSFVMLGSAIVLSICFQGTLQNDVVTNVSEDYFTDITPRPEKVVEDANQLSCPPEQSLHTAEDIQSIIEYVFNRMEYGETINKTYESEAADLQNLYLQNISKFQAWIENRPTHLIHILADLAAIRHRYVEPVAYQLSIDLKENPLLKEQFRGRLKTSQNLMRTLKNYEMICKYNCEEKLEHNVRKRSTEEFRDQEGYYCSSIEDLHEEIKNKLGAIVEQITDQIQIKLSEVSEYYSARINFVEHNIKERALRKFSRTMYDILELQDEYHHFKEDFLKINVSEKTYSVKDLGLLIDTKLFKLHRSVKQYGDYCRNCNNVAPIQIEPLNADEHDRYFSPSIVDSLIRMKQVNVWNNFVKDLINNFSKLETTIVSTEDVDDYLEKLEPLQKEVLELTNQEKEALNELKNLLPQSSFDILFDLVKESQELLVDIEESLKKLGIYS